MWFSVETCYRNLLNRRHHVPPCCNAMQALLSWEGKGTKPTQVNWELTVLVAAWHLGTRLCMDTEGIASPADGDGCAQSGGRQSWVQLLDTGHGCWTSALKEPVGKQLGLGRCQCRGTAWRQTVQKSCLGIFRLLFSLDGGPAWKRAAAGRPAAPRPLLDGLRDLGQELLMHKAK